MAVFLAIVSPLSLTGGHNQRANKQRAPCRFAEIAGEPNTIHITIYYGGLQIAKSAHFHTLFARLTATINQHLSNTV
jgi:hypothetical protein